MGLGIDLEYGKNYIFFNHTETLWSQDDGKPTINSSTDSKVEFPHSSHKEKLQGEYTWPISVTLPKEIKLTPAHETEPRTFLLPHSFNEKFIRATINYTATVKIHRFELGIFKDDHE